MRTVIALGFVLAMGLSVPVGAWAAVVRRAAGERTVKGDVKNAQGEKLAQNKVRITNTTNGRLRRT
jgi:hypothetical protein